VLEMHHSTSGVPPQLRVLIDLEGISTKWEGIFFKRLPHPSAHTDKWTNHHPGDDPINRSMKVSAHSF
jgi:hypothetical protein